MKLFTFTSQARPEVHAFTGESSGGTLPDRLGPWTATGVVRDDQPLPKRFSRPDIERGIADVGYQLWRRVAASKGA